MLSKPEVAKAHLTAPFRAVRAKGLVHVVDMAQPRKPRAPRRAMCAVEVRVKAKHLGQIIPPHGFCGKCIYQYRKIKAASPPQTGSGDVNGVS